MKVRIGQNPTFTSVTGLTNRSFDAGNITEGQMVSEEQLLSVYERIVEDEKRADACCRDIVFWEARTQIVRLNNNEVRSAYGGYFNAPGIIVSDWNENVNYGTLRRGLSYEVEFPVKWDDGLYYPVTAERINNSNCSVATYSSNNQVNCHHKTVQFRFLEDSDDIYGAYRCTSTSSNRRDFFLSADGGSITSQGDIRGRGVLVNSCTNWGQFILVVKDDGTITIKDNRRNTNYDIIRFYVQLTLNRCANNSLLSDREGSIFPNGRPDW